jgi:hypothetical protein
MKKIAIIAVLIITIFSISSCETELFDGSSTQKINDDLSLKNGRMVFQSKEALAEFYKEYADASDEKLSKLLDPMYKNGFYSLRPIVTESNESFLHEHYKKKIKTNNQSKVIEEDAFDYLDDLEDIIGDDAFAAFLNSDAEIQVADEIYKYTDVGLFFTKEVKLSILEEYLLSKNISLDLTIQTPLTVKQSIITEFPSNNIDGITIINEDVSYFRYPAPDDCYNPDDPCYSGGGGGGSGGGGSGGGGSGYSDPTSANYLAFSSSLQNCGQVGGIWDFISSWFGDNYRCIDKYENRRRVKTKGFNYNYFLVYHMGVKCVHQYKGWTGFWRVEATDEIRLVVEAVQFEYDVDRLLNNALANNHAQEKAYYLNNQKILYQPNSMYIGGVTYTGLNHASLPQIFQNDGMGLSFEMFGTNSAFVDNLIQNGINSSLSAGQLNNIFWNQLYSQTTTFLRSALNNNSYIVPDNRTFVAKFPENGKLIVQKSISQQAFNNGVKQQTFDWGGEIRFTATEGNGSWSMSGGQGDQLMRPKNFRVKMIGAARRWGAWHGSKLSEGIY